MGKFLSYLAGLLFLGGIGTVVIALPNADLGSVTWGIILIVASLIVFFLACCIPPSTRK